MRKRFWITSDVPDQDTYFIRSGNVTDPSVYVPRIIADKKYSFSFDGVSFTKIEPYDQDVEIKYETVKDRNKTLKENEIKFINPSDPWWKENI